MLLDGACSKPPPTAEKSGPVSGVEIMRKLSKSHTHNESGLKIKVCVCLSGGKLESFNLLAYIGYIINVLQHKDCLH